VGLAWAGWRGHFNDANRSMTLKDLGPLAETGAAFFSLQKWKTGASHLGAEPTMRIVDWTDEFADMADTAGLIANLDLVISVDTSVAHLAGAMGARVWVLLPKTADWRWLLDREDSPWYPTMKLFRQERLGDWTGVVGRVVREMGNLRFE
jgi:glycosyl transferase family 9 (putative heptosyltransferase)